MSYDINIGGEWFNYTYNMAPLFRAHLPNGDGITGLNGMTGKQASLEIDTFFQSAENERFFLFNHSDTCITVDNKLRGKYDPDNGWGSYIGALLFMEKVAAACRRHPRAKVRVS